jgi:hypothetical protein
VSGPNAEAASLGEDIPCAAGVRGDGPCSFELCPPGIGCRRVREQRQQGEGGAVLDRLLRPYELKELREVQEWSADDVPGAHNARWLLELVDRLCLEIAQARAEERERIARRFDSMDGDGWGSLAPVVTGLFEQVARIVRGTS